MVGTANAIAGETSRANRVTKPKLLTFGVIVLASLITGLFWQQQQVQQMRADNARLVANRAELDALRDEILRLRQAQVDPAELERLRQGQAELLRLRGEASQLRRQLKDVEQARRSARVKESPPASAVVEEEAAPVETYTATVRVSLASKQTLITGGWAVPNNKRGLVLIEPAIGGDADQAGQVIIQARFVELPEEVLSKVGMDGLKSDGKESSIQSILTAEQSEAVLSELKETQGVNVLSAPKISTLDGRQAQMKVGGTRTVNGVVFEVGPSVDVVPHVSPDGNSVDLTVIARLRYQTPNNE
jgi:type II secretory pathway component PulM